jgi:hypothetical protein
LELPPPNKVGVVRVEQTHEYTIWQVATDCAVDSFLAGICQPVAVHVLVDQFDAGVLSKTGDLVSGQPCSFEPTIVSAATLTAGTVSSSKSSGFVEEEQFRVVAERHQIAFAFSELGQARNPCLIRTDLPDNPPMVVVKASAIAHEHPTIWYGDDLAEWCHSVLNWHCWFCAGFIAFTVEP